MIEKGGTLIMAESGGCVLARHEERIKNLEADFGEMKSCLRKIHGLLLTLAGGMIVSLVLLVINLAAAGR